tara:strand:+ start:736 stop:1335 length:600 start_codon:yes stop_codon:yes gene_type:complete
MISILNKNNKLDECKNTLNVTYPRNIQIIYGTYPYPELVHQFIIEIKNNLTPKMKNFTNVKGGMTDWKYFLEKSIFKNFIVHLINKHQSTNPDLFQYFLEKKYILDAWGNEIKLGDSLNYHTHSCYHGILYLTEGCDLILPELNIKITPQPGDYYIFPPEILHGFEKSIEEKNRYSLIFNITDSNNSFEFKKKYERKNS